MIRNISIAITCAAMLAQAQQPADSGTVIRSETRVVLVDAVVTDKKGGYIHDLTAKDFKVYEDGKEQKVSSFSFEADPASPLNAEPRYMVLFFDYSTMALNDQAVARRAAAQFIDANMGAKAGPNRQMAIVNFGGSLQIAQNFTADPERLKAAVSGVKISSTTTQASGGSGPMAQISQAQARFGQRDSILALRDLAKNLAGVRGRKTLILLTAGFPLNTELMSEVTATIDVSNRSNVAIYPIDVRGLVASDGGHDDAAILPASPFILASYSQTTGGGTRTGGSTGSTGGTRTGGATGGAAGGGISRTGGAPSGGTARTPTAAPATTIRPPVGTPINPNAGQQRSLIPPFPKTALTNQEVMYMLADGTGGFVILNTNDLVGGMDRIAKELNEYYLLGYTPGESKEGSCHALHVKLDKGGMNVRARTGYCNAKSADVLARNPAEKTLETRAASDQPGNLAAALQAPYFYTAANEARVNIALEMATDKLKFEKEKGKFHVSIDVLGIASKADGSVAARFSDTVNLDFESKKDVEAFQEKTYHYENQFEIAPGIYKMKIAFSSGGDGFGKAEQPLVVDAYDGAGFAVSPVAFSTSYSPVAQSGEGLDATLLEDRTPLVVLGLHLLPSGTNKFKASSKPLIYFEVYDPGLLTSTSEKPVMIGLEVRVLDRATGAQKADSGAFRIPIPDKPTAMIPWGAKIPVEELPPGAYRVVIEAADTNGGKTVRTAEFVIE